MECIIESYSYLKYKVARNRETERESNKHQVKRRAKEEFSTGLETGTISKVLCPWLEVDLEYGGKKGFYCSLEC